MIVFFDVCFLYFFCFSQVGILVKIPYSKNVNQTQKSSSLLVQGLKQNSLFLISTAPVYQFLKSSAGGFLGDLTKWNVEKFLVHKNGKVVERYQPTTSPFQIEVLFSFLLCIRFKVLEVPCYLYTS